MLKISMYLTANYQNSAQVLCIRARKVSHYNIYFCEAVYTKSA